MTDTDLDRLVQICAAATQVVKWYVHPDEVRGPFGRWFRILGPEEAVDGKQRQGSKSDDLEYCAAAMNAMPELLQEVKRLREALESVERQAAYDQEKCHCNADRPAFEWYYTRSRKALATGGAR